MPEKIGLGAGIPFSSSGVAGGGGGPTLLSPGVYWADGGVSLAPNVGNYVATTKITDGNTAAGEQASAGSVTWVHVLASPLSLSNWEATVYFIGGLSVTFSYWNGSAWVDLIEVGGIGTPFGLEYSNFTMSSDFLGTPSSTIFRAVATESPTTTPAITVTDSHLS